ncbi:hypothetical protein [Pseudomonas phage PIP]|nr:hypothetical protein [Pseudomonas phage PIP]
MTLKIPTDDPATDSMPNKTGTATEIQDPPTVE